MAKKGRPFTYQSDDDKPVTISMRVSKELHTRLERYAKQHRQSISELMRDGIEWRIGEGDPRSLSVGGSTSSPQEYYGNTEGDMLAEIRADNERVLQEVLHGFAQQESQIESLLRVLEQRLPLGNNGANYSNTTIDNTVIQSEHREQVPTTGEEPARGTAFIENMPLVAEAGADVETAYYGNTVIYQAHVLQAAQNPALARGEVPTFDTSKFYLGALCPKGHGFHGTGQSLRRQHNMSCRECENTAKREKRAREKAERDAQPVAD